MNPLHITSGNMPLQLDVRHYETVVAIVELGTMTAAAEHLSMTQSALSHRLAEAERRLGTALFERSAQRRLRPTRAGIVVHQAAARALDDLERLEATLRADRGGVYATVRLSVGSYDCYHWYPSLVSAAGKQLPDIGLELVAGDDSPGVALASGSVDLVIAPGTPDGALQLHDLFRDELVLIVSPGHRLAKNEWIAPEDLAAETYLTYNLTPNPGFEYERFVRPADVYPRVVTVVQQTNAITELVAAGLGVSILSRWALAPAIEAGRVVPLRCGREGLSLDWNVAMRVGDDDTSPVGRVASMLRDHFASAASR